MSASIREAVEKLWRVGKPTYAHLPPTGASSNYEPECGVHVFDERQTYTTHVFGLQWRSVRFNNVQNASAAADTDRKVIRRNHVAMVLWNANPSNGRSPVS